MGTRAAPGGLQSAHDVHPATDRHHRTRGRLIRGPVSRVGYREPGRHRRICTHESDRGAGVVLRVSRPNRSGPPTPQRSVHHPRRDCGWVNCGSSRAARSARFSKPRDFQSFASAAVISSCRRLPRALRRRCPSPIMRNSRPARSPASSGNLGYPGLASRADSPWQRGVAS